MNKKILIIGESCKDIFIYCSSNRLAPDIPVPVLNILYQTENPGMAKNVQRNVDKIFNHCDILTNNNWESITKTRYMHLDSNHMFIRVDSDHSKISKINLNDINFNYDLIAISDYNKGFLDEKDIEYICSKHENVFLDTKKKINNWASKAKIIKINNYEYNQSKNSMSKELLNKTIRTNGPEGCFFQDERYPVNKIQVKDSSGAGDTFFAGLIATYVKTNNIKESIKFANACASKVVQEKGVTTI
jgi:bifunctional ADP-heptose synthase (sugar kinase/adenylyltransferase)